MSKALFFCLSIILFLLSCKEEINNNEETIDISRSLNNKEMIPLDRIALNIAYIPLQSDTNCLIGRIKQPERNIYFYDSMVFITDESKVLSFDLNGKFLRKYGNKGRGPSEYGNIENFTILPNKKQIVIFSSQMQKLLFFNFDGNFINSSNISFWPTALTSFNDELIFISSKGRRHLSDYFALSVLSGNNEVFKRLIYRDNEKNKDVGLDPFKDNFYILNNKFNYWEFNYDTIWSISKDLKIHSKRYIYYGKEKLPVKYIYLPDIKKYEEMKRHSMLWNYYETNRYMFFELDNKTKLNHIYYDKSTKNSFNLKFRDENNRLNLSFLNNIDGGFNFWPDGIAGENKVFKIINGYELKKHLENFKNKQGNYDTSLNEKLQKLANHAKMDDNPIIMVVTLKDIND